MSVRMSVRMSAAAGAASFPAIFRFKLFLFVAGLRCPLVGTEVVLYPSGRKDGSIFGGFFASFPNKKK